MRNGVYTKRKTPSRDDVVPVAVLDRARKERSPGRPDGNMPGHLRCDGGHLGLKSAPGAFPRALGFKSLLVCRKGCRVNPASFSGTGGGT